MPRFQSLTRGIVEVRHDGFELRRNTTIFFNGASILPCTHRAAGVQKDRTLMPLGLSLGRDVLIDPASLDDLRGDSPGGHRRYRRGLKSLTAETPG
jgi:hypothetical protein